MESAGTKATTSLRMGWPQWGMLCLCAMLWGSAYVFNAIAIKELPHLTITLLRLTIAAAFLNLMLRYYGLSLPSGWPTWRSFFILTLLSNVGPYLLVLRGQTGTTSGLAAVLTATTPLFTILIAHLYTKDERITLNKLAGVVVGMIGVAIVVGPDAWAGATSSFVAKLALVGASLLYAIGSIYAKRWQGMPPLVIAATLMTSGALMSLPLSLVFDRPWTLPSPSLEVWLAVAFTGVFGSALAAITYFRVFAVSGATNAMLVTLLLPITPIIGGALYLGEKLAMREFAGTAVVMLALVIIDGRAARWLLSQRT